MVAFHKYMLDHGVYLYATGTPCSSSAAHHHEDQLQEGFAILDKASKLPMLPSRGDTACAPFKAYAFYPPHALILDLPMNTPAQIPGPAYRIETPPWSSAVLNLPTSRVLSMPSNPMLNISNPGCPGLGVTQRFSKCSSVCAFRGRFDIGQDYST
jgi:hypothetical protein